MFFHNQGALYPYVAITSGVLPRYTKEVNVWKTVQSEILVVDVCALGMYCLVLGQQGRLDPAEWRQLGWFSVVLAVSVTVLRCCFMLGVGQ